MIGGLRLIGTGLYVKTWASELKYSTIDSVSTRSD